MMAHSCLLINIIPGRIMRSNDPVLQTMNQLEFYDRKVNTLYVLYTKIKKTDINACFSASNKLRKKYENI